MYSSKNEKICLETCNIIIVRHLQSTNLATFKYISRDFGLLKMLWRNKKPGLTNNYLILLTAHIVAKNVLNLKLQKYIYWNHWNVLAIIYYWKIVLGNSSLKNRELQNQFLNSKSRMQHTSATNTRIFQFAISYTRKIMQKHFVTFWLFRISFSSSSFQ